MTPEGGSLPPGEIRPDVIFPDCARIMGKPEESGYVLLADHPPTERES